MRLHFKLDVACYLSCSRPVVLWYAQKASALRLSCALSDSQQLSSSFGPGLIYFFYLILISDSFDSSPHPSMDDLDYEEPPVELVIKKSNPPAPRKQQLNNLSSDFHDYDEPEGIIVISDHEDNPHEQAIQDNIDFHDYADPDDTDEDNTNCHVVVKEDAACYHDYADPDYDDPAD